MDEVEVNESLNLVAISTHLSPDYRFIFRLTRPSAASNGAKLLPFCPRRFCDPLQGRELELWNVSLTFKPSS